jgi:hypothetical protein
MKIACLGMFFTNPMIRNPIEMSALLIRIAGLSAPNNTAARTPHWSEVLSG